MMSIVPAPKYSIIFYNNYWVGESTKRESIKGIQLLDEVAKIIRVEVNDILKAFREWGLADYPQEFFYKLEETNIDTRGKEIEYVIKLWNYQGGRENSKGEPYQFGKICKARSWGKKYNDETTSVYFYLGAIA